MVVLTYASNMEPLFSSENLIFHHIPKCGGTTVTSLLETNFAPQDICRLVFYYELDTLSPQERTKYKFFRGHFFYPQLQDLDAKRITFVRDPVERVLSEHRFWIEFYKGREEDLFHEHFLPPGDPLFTMQNHQCLFLSSFDPRDPTISIKQHLKSAKANLKNKFFFVGITEDLERGLKALYILMNWPSLQTVPHLLRTRPTGEVFSKKMLEGIRKRNWADIQLYKYASRIYASKLKKINSLPKGKRALGSGRTKRAPQQLQ